MGHLLPLFSRCSARLFVLWILKWLLCLPWWRHQMETFSALLAICAGNSPVTGEFPTQRPVTRSFAVFFDLHPNKRLSKQWWGWWFETQSWSLWRHWNDICVTHNTMYGNFINIFQSPYSSEIRNVPLKSQINYTSVKEIRKIFTALTCNYFWVLLSFQVFATPLL